MSQKLRPVERAFIAGFFDGEGCVYFRNGWKTPEISIVQKEPEILHWLQGKLGYGRIHPQREYWQYRIGARREVLDFVEVILKYSIVKRKKLLQARRVLREAVDMERPT